MYKQLNNKFKTKISIKRGFSETNKYLVQVSDAYGGLGTYYSNLQDALKRYKELVK